LTFHKEKSTTKQISKTAEKEKKRAENFAPEIYCWDPGTSKGRFWVQTQWCTGGK
jgi:hypothetical protein